MQRASAATCTRRPARILTIEAQLKANGATWLDRQLLARETTSLSDGGFGREVREAMDARVEHLVERRTCASARAARDLHTRPARYAAPARARHRQRKDLGGDRSALSFRWPRAKHVAGVYRQRVSLASGPLRHDRRRARIQSRALDTVIGTPAWQASVRIECGRAA